MITKSQLSPEQDKQHFMYIYVAGMSFMAFHFMLDSLSGINDKDKQQVCNDISISVWEC